jgi:hypothetical protein
MKDSLAAMEQPTDDEARCKVCDEELSGWRPGIPLLCDDHNPNRRGPVRESEDLSRVSFEQWIRRTLWYAAAP